MEFASFDEALSICLTAEDKSKEQIAAMLYCLENAPPELLEILQAQFGKSNENGDCGCGCTEGGQHNCTD